MSQVKVSSDAELKNFYLLVTRSCDLCTMDCSRTKAHTFLCTALFTKNTTTSDQNDLYIAWTRRAVVAFWHHFELGRLQPKGDMALWSYFRQNGVRLKLKNGCNSVINWPSLMKFCMQLVSTDKLSAGSPRPKGASSKANKPLKVISRQFLP